MKQSLINLTTPEHVLILGFVLIGLGVAGLTLWVVIFLTIRIRKMRQRSRQLRAKKSQSMTAEKRQKDRQNSSN